MLYYLWDYIYPIILKYPSLSFLNALQYTSIKLAMAFTLSLCLSFIIAPLTIRFLKKKKVGQFIRDDGPKSHYNKQGTPTMGGIIILLPTIITALLILPLHHPIVWITLISFVGFGLIGFWDDYLKLIKKQNLGLSAKKKFTAQFVVSLIIGIAIYTYTNTSLYVPLKKDPLLSLGYFMIPFAIFVVISWSNAVNLTDGLDGLAAGLTAFLLITIGVFSYFQGNSLVAAYLNLPFIQHANEITVFIFALLGSLTTFLWFNFYPAQIFMGDTGSLALGAVIGTLSLILKREFIIVFTGLIFIIEIISVVLQVLYYKKTKKRIFRMAPLHHHFELGGVPESKIVIRFWIIGIFLMIISITCSKFF